MGLLTDVQNKQQNRNDTAVVPEVLEQTLSQSAEQLEQVPEELKSNEFREFSLGLALQTVNEAAAQHFHIVAEDVAAGSPLPEFVPVSKGYAGWVARRRDEARVKEFKKAHPGNELLDYRALRCVERFDADKQFKEDELRRYCRQNGVDAETALQKDAAVSGGVFAAFCKRYETDGQGNPVGDAGREARAYNDAMAKAWLSGSLEARLPLLKEWVQEVNAMKLSLAMTNFEWLQDHVEEYRTVTGKILALQNAMNDEVNKPFFDALPHTVREFLQSKAAVADMLNQVLSAKADQKGVSLTDTVCVKETAARSEELTEEKDRRLSALLTGYAEKTRQLDELSKQIGAKEISAQEREEKAQRAISSKEQLVDYTNDRIKELRAAAVFRIDSENMCRRVLANITLLEQELGEHISGAKNSALAGTKALIDERIKALETENAKEYNQKNMAQNEEEQRRMNEAEISSYEHEMDYLMQEEGLSFEEALAAFTNHHLEAKKPYTLAHLGEATQEQMEAYREVETYSLRTLQKFNKSRKTELTEEQADQLIKDYMDAVVKNMPDQSYQIRVGDPNTIGLILQTGRFKTQIEGEVAKGGGGLDLLRRRQFTAEKFGTNKLKKKGAEDAQLLYKKYQERSGVRIEKGVFVRDDSMRLSPEESAELEKTLRENRNLNILPNEQYEVYGYLSHGDTVKEVQSKINDVGYYGQVIVKLKPERMKERITMFLGDSLNEMTNAHPVKMGEPMGLYNVQASGRQILLEHALEYSRRKQQEGYDPKADEELSLEYVLEEVSTEYMELQFHGGVSVEDIESVTINGDAQEGDFIDGAYKPHEKLPDHIVEMLREKGIKAYNIRNGVLSEATTSQEDLLAEYKNLTEELKTSKKGGFLGGFRSNSPEFQAVLTNLDESYGKLDKEKPKTMAEVLSKGEELKGALEKTMAACKTYMDAAGGKTENGAIRKTLVQRAYLTVMNDLACLTDSLKGLSADGPMQMGFTWNSLMRGRQINTYTDLGTLKHYGGAISTLVELTNKEDPLGGGMFKEDHPVTAKNETELFALCKTIALEQLKEDGYQLTKEDRQAFDEMKAPGQLVVPVGKPMLSLAMEYLQAVFRPMRSEMNNVGYMGMVRKEQPDGSNGVNLADRDVATYRLATLFGKSALVAKSEKVTVKNWNNSYTGHLMQKVEGEEAVSFSAGLIRQKRAEGKSEQLTFEDVKDHLTGSFLRDMNNMVILDYICGQRDRHTANYMVIKDANGKLAGVKCIDNNLAFGSDPDYNFEVYSYLPLPVSKDGELLLKHMDAELANTILAMRPALIAQQLSGLLAAEEIRLVQERVEKLQRAIKAEIDKGNEGLLLHEEAEWLEHAEEDMTMKNNERTYFGDFANDYGLMAKSQADVVITKEKGAQWLKEREKAPGDAFIADLKKMFGSDPRKLDLLNTLKCLQLPGKLPENYDRSAFNPARLMLQRKKLVSGKADLDGAWTVSEVPLSATEQKLADGLVWDIGKEISR